MKWAAVGHECKSKTNTWIPAKKHCREDEFYENEFNEDEFNADEFYENGFNEVEFNLVELNEIEWSQSDISPCSGVFEAPRCKCS